jgi:hypothetical protein
MEEQNFTSSAPAAVPSPSAHGHHPVAVGDVTIQFPYMPYSCQSDFMHKVVEALNMVN